MIVWERFINTGQSEALSTFQTSFLYNFLLVLVKKILWLKDSSNGFFLSHFIAFVMAEQIYLRVKKALSLDFEHSIEIHFIYYVNKTNLFVFTVIIE